MNQNEIDQIFADFEDLKSRMEEMGQKTEKKAEQKSRMYAEELRDRAQQAMSRAKEAGKKADEFAHRKPWLLMAIGLGTGLVVGITLGIMAKKKCPHC